MTNRPFLIFALAVAITGGTAKAAQSIDIPCVANTPCESIVFTAADPTHGTIAITVSVPKVETTILSAAEGVINDHLPGFLTQEINLGDIRYLNGRILFHQAIVGAITKLRLAPIQTPFPCGLPPRPLCPSPGPGPGQPFPPTGPPFPIPQPFGQVAVRLVDEYQKELDHYDPWPLPGHWNNSGWPTVGKFTVYGGATFGVDVPAALPLQHLVVAFRATDVRGDITLKAIQGPVMIPLSGVSSNLSFGLIDQATAQKYGVEHLSVSGVTLTSINTSHAIITATISPAPANSAARLLLLRQLASVGMRAGDPVPVKKLLNAIEREISTACHNRSGCAESELRAFVGFLDRYVADAIRYGYGDVHVQAGLNCVSRTPFEDSSRWRRMGECYAR